MPVALEHRPECRSWRDRLASSLLRVWAPEARLRRGMTLMEILVAIAIMLLITAVLIPSLDGVLLLEQIKSARRITMMYAQLHDEAILRNKTFRVAYHIDEGFYEIQMGDPEAMIFADFEQREEAMEKHADVLEDMTEEEIKEYQKQNDFKSVDGDFGGKFELPANTRFRSVYTPQYEEPVLPTEFDTKRKRKAVSGSDEDEGPRVIYSYVFSNGFSEFTVVQLVDKKDDKDGFTITVDPMSGKVDLFSDLVDRHDLFKDLPDEGPRLSD